MSRVFLILFAFITMCSSASFAQETIQYDIEPETKKVIYRSVIELPDLNAEEVEKRIDRLFNKNKELFFKTSGLIETKDRQWALGRMKWLGVDGEYGVLDKSTDKEGNGKVFFAAGNSYDACVMFLCFYADITVEWKNDKCRITLTNFHYRHSTFGSPPGKRGLVGKRGKKEPYGAPLEYLINNNEICTNSLPNILKWLDKQSKELLNDISIGLKQEKRSDNNW